MMVLIKIIDIPPPVELNILTEYDAFIFAIIAFLLIIVFIKIKFFHKSVEPDTINKTEHILLENETERTLLEFESRDVLMQPKKKIDESVIPFKNFSLDFFHIIFATILFIIFIYLLDVIN